MTNDHFVAQTYLKHFGDPSRNGMLNAYRKTDGAAFPCWPADVCHEWDGDINTMMSDANLLGNYRMLFEPSWNISVENLVARNLSPEDMLALSGYVANLMGCTPTQRRIGVKMHDDHAKGLLSFKKKMTQKHSGGDAELVEAITALEEGKIRLATDPEYIKAMATRALVDFAVTIYHADWLIIDNATDELFVTSDNPVSFVNGENPTVSVKYVPITPRLCLRIVFDADRAPPRRMKPEEMAQAIGQPPRGRVTRTKFTAAGIRTINKAVTQCAEELVFSPVASDGIHGLVKKYANWRVEANYVELRDSGDSVIQGSIIRVEERKTA